MAYYAVLAAKGFIPVQTLPTFGTYDSILGQHPDGTLIPGVEIASGSLGHGLPIAVGMAAALNLKGVDGPRVFCLVGDAELDEGSNHEAVVVAGFVSVGASFDAAASGRTHQAPEDVALISTLPGWRVHVPGHPDEVEAVLRSAVTGTGCDYIRLAESINSRAILSSNGISVVRRGSESAVTVIAVGPSLEPALEATADLDATVLYASTVRPFDAETLRATITSPAVVLVEPYLSGTSSAEVSAALIDVPHRLFAIGVPRVEHRRYGSGTEHQTAHGLDAAGIRSRIAGFLDA